MSTLITTAEAAKMLAVSRQTVRRYVRHGQLLAVRLPGKNLRVDLTSVQALIERGRKETT